MTQGLAQERNCSCYLYGGIGFTLPEYRAGDKKGVPFFLNYGQKWAEKNNSLFSFMGTYPGFETMTSRAFPGMFKTLCNVAYKDLTVNLAGTQPNFQGLKDGMILYASNKKSWNER